MGNVLRRACLCATSLALTACPESSGDGLGTSINEDLGWRVVATSPHTDPLPNEPNAITPLAGSWLGFVDGRLYVGTQSIISRAIAPRQEPTAISFDAEGDESPRDLGTVWPVPFDTDNQVSVVLDVPTHYYGWGTSELGIPQLHSAAFDTLDETVVFDGVGITLLSALPAYGQANAALDVVVHQTTDANLSVLGVYDAPELFVRAHTDAAVTSYTIDRHELFRPRDYDGSAYFVGGQLAAFNPPGSTPHLFQVVTRGPSGGDGFQRYSLVTFTPSTDPSATAAGFQVLRVTSETPLPAPMDLHLAATPHGAWLLLEDKVTQLWRVYHFDRSTAELSLDYELASPLRPTDVIYDVVATDDGAIYVSANLYPVPDHLRVVRVFDGAAADLWDPKLEKNPEEFHFFGLYSTGARVYASVADTYFPDQKTEPRPRWTFITPDLPAVPPPAPPSDEPLFSPPEMCNPLTNVPCSANEACDVGPSRNGWACADAGPAGLCEACNPETGPYCAAGYTCRRLVDGDPASGECLKLCCTNEDCGATCVNSLDFPVGYCAIYNGSTFDPQCSGLPTGPAPSGGACSELVP
ncbi:MAG: hypothetical protein U0271_46275 [Polyangiaceae bacterium]